MKKLKLTIVASGVRKDGTYWFVGITGGKPDKDGFITQGNAYIFGHIEDKFSKNEVYEIPENVCKPAVPK